MKTGLIYRALFPNNKYYVGKTTKTLEKRIYQHLIDHKRKKRNYKFYNAIKKYGFENIKWEVIQDNIPEELLSIVEIYQIATHNSYYSGYNSTMGGEGQSR